MKKILLQCGYNSLFSIIFFFLFVIVNLGYYYFLAFSFQLSTLFYVWLLEFAALGFAYECTEIILGLILRESDVPRVNKLRDYPPVALLCVTCDDIDTNILKNLGHQTYPNLHIFILDDSQRKESRLAADSLEFKVIRRSGRIGYKAGNLNHWLFRYGSYFPYFVVADADSLLPDRFVEQMVCYAEHPDNHRIAIFESLIHAWNRGNGFVRLQSIMKPVVHRNKLRLDNRFESTLSVGHNNLYRTAIVMDIGGFNENYMAEDYATSIEILRGRKWLCRTVPVISYERLPANLNEFAKRQARWAFQTFQLLNLNISGLRWNVRLKILGTLHNYLMPIVASVGMILLVFFNLQHWMFAPNLHISQEMIGVFIKSKFFLFWLMYLFLPFLLRTILILREGVTIGEYLRSILFHSALFVATIWPVIRRLTTFWTGDRLGFNVTSKATCPSLLQILKLGGPGFALTWIALLSVVLNPMLSALNLIWILPISLSPLLIYYYQRSTI